MTATMLISQQAMGLQHSRYQLEKMALYPVILKDGVSHSFTVSISKDLKGEKLFRSFLLI